MRSFKSAFLSRHRISLRVVAAVTAVVLFAPALLAVELAYVLVVGGSTPERPRDVSLDDGSPVAVWLGDSFAAGVGAGSGQTALPRLVANASGGRSVRVLATPGATVSDVLSRQIAEVPDAAVDVYICVGVNDVKVRTSRSDYEDRYRRIIQRAPEGSRVFVLALPDLAQFPRFPWPLNRVIGMRSDQLNRSLSRVAAETGATYVDAAAIDDAIRRDGRSLFASDKYHFDDDGYQAWAAAIVTAAAEIPRRPTVATP